MKKISTRKPPKPNESEYEELIRLRAEKEAVRLKAKKQQSSKNSARVDTN